MSKKIIDAGFALVCGLALSTNVFAQDFCNAKHSGTPKTSSFSVNAGKDNQEIGNIGSYHYEQWAKSGSVSATFYTDGSFSCSFSNSDDYLCREGLFYGSNSGKDPLSVGHLVADFSMSSFKNNAGISYAYVGVYGWMQNPLIEWYIVDSWGTASRPTWVGGDVDKAPFKTVTIDGAQYDLYRNKANRATIEGSKAFEQIYSVRKSKRDCGTIDIYAHFKAWKDAGITIGKSLYEAKVLGEAGQYPENHGASGSIDFNYAKVYVVSAAASSSSVKPASSSSVPASSSSKPASSSSEAKAAYSSNAIPGVIEFENYDYGGNGVSYKGAQAGKADYATDKRPSDDVDIIGTDDGYGVGNVQPDQWMEYTVKVAKTADYSLTVKGLSGAETDRNISFLVDGKEWNSVKVKAVADNWSDFSESNASAAAKLTAGSHVIRAVFDGYANVDWFKLTEVIPPSSSSMKVSSSSVLPLSSSSEIAIPASSSSEVIVPETSSSEMITESSSSQIVLPPTSSSDEIVIPESSSSDVIIAETSSSMESLLPSSSSVVTAAIAKIHLQISERDLLVFDMQGKFLGKIEVKNGESLNEVLKTRFRKSGAYLVKQDHLMQRVNVK